MASPSGLVAWWPGDAHARDIQGGNHGALKNGATYAVGEVFEGFGFDGVDDYVDTALDVQPSAMPVTTWEFWVYPTRPGGRQQILSCDDGGYDRSVLVEGNSFGVFTGYGVWTPVPLTPGEWQHVAVVFSPTNLLFYKNGQRFSLGSAPAGQGTGSKLQIARNPGFGEYFQGRIDEVAIFNRALTDGEVEASFHAGAAGRCKSQEGCFDVSLSPEALPAALIGAAYNQSLTASGGTPPYTFTLSAGQLPPGISLSSGGVLTGTSTNLAEDLIVIRATDAAGCTSARNYTLVSTDGAADCAPAPNGLVSWWKAERSGTDGSGTNHGGLFNNVTFTAGRVGRAFSFSGNSYVETGTNGLHLGLGDFSFEGWLKTTSVKGYSAIVSFDGYAPAFYVRSDGRLGHFSGGTPDMRSTDAGFNDGAWHHFAIVRQSSFLSYYKDGLPSGTHTNAPFNVVLKPTRFFIGADTDGADFFDGLIDELSFYNRALTAGEVAAIAGARSAGKCEPGTVPAVPVPVITALEAPSGAAGTAVSISGSAFSRIAANNRVEFNGVAAVVVNATTNEMLVIVPAQLAPGVVPVRVSVAGQASASANFTVTTPPTSTAVRARLSGPNLLLSWSDPSASGALEWTRTLTPPVFWQPGTNSITAAADLRTASVTLEDAARFYRLRPAAPLPQAAGADISATQGGTITLPGGEASLQVPPGALSTNTAIQLVQMAQSLPNGTYSADFVFAPAGVRFSIPATLSIALPPDTNPEDVSLYSMSALNEISRSGAESNLVHAVTDYSFDTATRTLRVPVRHFSALNLLAQRFRTEIVFDIPGRYLKKGDLIFALTQDGFPAVKALGWIPGHVGMYLGTTNASSTNNDGKTIIESTSADTTTNKAFGGYVDGVQVREDFDQSGGAFKNMSGNHLYMGARRPRPEPSDEDRTQIAEWALSKRGTNYAMVGGTFLSSGNSGLSCVGLTERAYESAGRNIVPGLLEFPLLPVRQYAFTEAVTEITMTAGERLVMPVDAVVARTAGSYVTGDALGYKLRVSGADDSPAAAVIANGHARLAERLFFFEPTNDDADLAYAFRFTLDGSAAERESRTVVFLIYVKEKAPASSVFLRQDPPVITLESASFAGDLFVTNTYAYVTPSSGQARLTWAEPPPQLVAGQSYPLTITPDPANAPPRIDYSSTSPASPRRLYGDVNIMPSLFSDIFAFIGYTEPVTPCASGRCYQLTHNPVTRTFTPNAELEEFRITMHVTAYGGLTFGGNGERRGSVSWRYVRQK